MPIAPPLPTWEDEGNSSACPSTSQAANQFEDEDTDNDEDDEESKDGSENKRFNDKDGEKPFKKRNPKRKRMEESKINAKFADPDLEGILTCTDPDEISHVRSETQAICGWMGAGFPGAQPVSMDQNNLRLIVERKYQVSWKADGTR